MFPAWSNYLLPGLVVLALGMSVLAPTVIGLGFHPTTTDVGYQPIQPVSFSHALHAGNLKIDCRYCHSTVDRAGMAAIPATQVCMNCHVGIKSESPFLKPVRDSYATGAPIAWKKVHDLPDYAFFNHSAHVNQGIGCVSCHGRVDQMEVVQQTKSLSMAWCLACHRAPERHLRPRDKVTQMDWDPLDATGKTQDQLGKELKAFHQIQDSDSMTSCSKCHR